MALRAGAIRFNTDSSQMEIYDGNQWTGILATSPELETGGDTGLIGAVGTDGSYVNVVDKVNISTTGNAIDWADLNYGTAQNAAYGSRTFGVFAGGYDNPVRKSNVDYVTIASGGTATAGGTLTTARNLSGAGASSQTRGLHIGGYVGPAFPDTYVNTIDYTTISEKSAAVDFGDLAITNKIGTAGGLSSSTRGYILGGARYLAPDTTSFNTIQVVTISTTGDATDFGDMLAGYQNPTGTASQTRLVMGTGEAPSGNYNSLEYITISTLGNAADFGDKANTDSNRNAEWKA